MIDLTHLTEIRDILQNASTIAIVGLSPKKERPSNMVAAYLINAGITIIPVNPGHNTLMGLKCYPDLLSIPQKIDIVDIFRKSDDVLPIVKQAIEIGASTVWMQQGIVNLEAAEIAGKNNLKVIMDRCIKVDHASLLT
jgi:predicted CoA-binding protein